jgi:hypothetical protein
MRRFALFCRAFRLHERLREQAAARASSSGSASTACGPDYVERADAPLLQRLVREGISTRTAHPADAVAHVPVAHHAGALAFRPACTASSATRSTTPHATEIFLPQRRRDAPGRADLDHRQAPGHPHAGLRLAAVVRADGPVRDDYFLDKFESTRPTGSVSTACWTPGGATQSPAPAVC